MSSNISDHSSVNLPTVSLCEPSPPCRQWLLIGMIMLGADLVLGVLATVLEFRHWGEEGVTPDVLISYAAIMPQIVLIMSYLVLAREADARGLWKSVAGMLGSYLLMCLLSLVFMEVLPDAGNTAITITTALGILALLGFSISRIPRFGNLTGADQSPQMPATEPKESPSDGNIGWLGGIALFIAFLVLKGLGRRFIRPIFGAGLEADDWALIEFIAIFAFGLSFAIWFAITKIRLRGKLGTVSCVTGITEILILLVHAGMAAVILTVIVTEAAAAPQLDDAGIDQILDPWMKRGSLVSAVCHVVWVIVTAVLFASLRSRSGYDAAENPANLSEI
ncbi:MAG: hypothetical protein O3C40_01055 [Planctomycetota bacterium]|nr:hypothetical protein [Planctomycetota bacterium]